MDERVRRNWFVEVEMILQLEGWVKIGRGAIAKDTK